VHPVHEISQVVNPGHGKATLEDVGMFEQGIGGVIRAEGSAHGGNGDARLAVIPDERNDLFPKVGIENGLDIAAVKRVSVLVVKAEAIDGVDGIELDAAGIDEIGESADHALAFEFPFVASTGGKTEERRAPMAVGDNAEIETEARRVPAMVFTFHQKASLCAGEKYGSGRKDDQGEPEIWAKAGRRPSRNEVMVRIAISRVFWKRKQARLGRGVARQDGAIA